METVHNCHFGIVEGSQPGCYAEEDTIFHAVLHIGPRAGFYLAFGEDLETFQAGVLLCAADECGFFLGRVQDVIEKFAGGLGLIFRFNQGYVVLLCEEHRGIQNLNGIHSQMVPAQLHSRILTHCHHIEFGGKGAALRCLLKGELPFIRTETCCICHTADIISVLHKVQEHRTEEDIEARSPALVTAHDVGLVGACGGLLCESLPGTQGTGSVYIFLDEGVLVAGYYGLFTLGGEILQPGILAWPQQRQNPDFQAVQRRPQAIAVAPVDGLGLVARADQDLLQGIILEDSSVVVVQRLSEYSYFHFILISIL